MKIIKGMVSFLICLVLVFSSTGIYGNRVEAKATKQAMKFLSGTWVTAGQSAAVKVVFTQKYMKFYDCWNDSHTKVYGGKKLGKYMGKNKIISTKKKGKEWIIKARSNNGIVYYKGTEVGLICQWKENGEWQYSYSSSLEKISHGSSTQKKKQVSLERVKKDYLTLYYELQEEAKNSGESMYYSYIKVPGEKMPYLIMKRGRQNEQNHMWLKWFGQTKTLEFEALMVLHDGNYVICNRDKGMTGMEVWAYKLKDGKIKLFKSKEVLDGNSIKKTVKKFEKWISKNFKSQKGLFFDEVKWKQG